MKITVISPYLPSLNSGAPVRLYYLLKGLSVNNELTLFCALTGENEEDVIKLQKVLRINIYIFKLPTPDLKDRVLYYIKNKIPYVENLKRSNFNELIKLIPKDTDIIHINELQAYSIVEPYLDLLPGKKILDAHNVDYLRLKSEFDSSTLFRRILGIPVYLNLKKYEINALNKLDHVLVCSIVDKRIYAKQINESKLTVISNGANTKLFKKHGKVNKYQVFFMGQLSYGPNEFGLRWYIENVHPLIQKEIPKYKLIIAGINTPMWLKEKASMQASIVLKGFVKNVHEEISRAEICICPIFTGSGTRLKLLEYMALKKAVVSTTMGAEGLNVVNGEHMLIANTSKDFAESILELFKDQELRERLSIEGHVLIKKEYSWDKITNSLNTLYRNI